MNETNLYRINEIFYSLQGEGYHTGSAAVFVRFAGCNLKCDFCDTKHEAYNEYSLDDLLNDVSAYKTQIVILTGGEPSLQIDQMLIDGLHSIGMKVHIETNGTRHLPNGIDWITCSPKHNGNVVLSHIDELKVVYQGQTLEGYDQYECTYYFLQPCSNKNIKETVQAVMQNPKWRLSLQTHTLIGIK